MKVLFVTAEFSPFVKVGGLGDASAGLVGALTSLGAEVEVVLPDYGAIPLAGRSETPVDVPEWAGPARARRGFLGGVQACLISTPRLERTHPYVDESGVGWEDNDARFISYSAAAAAYAASVRPDVVHLNDWHTGAVLGFYPQPPPSILTIHNLAYQGVTSREWLARIPQSTDAFAWRGDANPLAGAIVLADRVVAVSPTYAEEIVRPEAGFGLDPVLSSREGDLIGILNGIDTAVWDPAKDPHIETKYDKTTIVLKKRAGRSLVEEMGWSGAAQPLIGMVTRLVDQKGVDLALEAFLSIERTETRMILLGSGEFDLADQARSLATKLPERFRFHERYDEGLSHRIFAGSDFYLMPSRFEPAGLTQMQAMRYGTIPVVTDVGGLRDTVVDADINPERGTGFVASDTTVASVQEALERAIHSSPSQRLEIQRRGMAVDWSWTRPARRYLELYEEISGSR